jgi:hypothetical protein
MKTKKTILRTRIKWILSLSLTIIAILICYGAFAQAKRYGSRTNNDNNAIRASAAQAIDLPQQPPDAESDPQFRELRRRFIESYLGLGSVSSVEHAKALAAARALPVSPLLGSWVYQALTPLSNQDGGSPCTTPVPQSTFCGASARIDAIAVDPTSADIVYVGTNGGISKSVDGGQEQWTYLSANLSSQSIKSIAIDPLAHNIVYAGTGVAGTGVTPSYGIGIYRSTDSGATWKTFGLSQFSGKTVGKIAIDPVTAGSGTSTTLYASVTDGNQSVWKSTNSGTNWTQILTPTGNGDAGPFYDLAIAPPGPLAPATLYSVRPNGLFKTTDGGTTWSGSIHPRGTPPNPSAAGCIVFVNNTLYIAFTEGNGTTSWVTVAYSGNGGTSWTEVNPAPAGLSCFGVDPSNANRMFVGDASQTAMRYSLDGGSTWIVVGMNMHADNRSMAFCPKNPPGIDRIYLGNDAGLYRADYNGVGSITWYTKNESLPGALMYGVSISSDDHMVIGTQDNGTQKGYAGQDPPWKMQKGGDGWKPKIDQTTSSKSYLIYYENEDQHDNCHIIPPDGKYRIWTDGGLHTSAAPWLLVDGNPNPANVTPNEANCELCSFFPGMFVAPSNSMRVLMGFQNVWRSTDSGSSWHQLGGGPSGIDPNLVVEVLYEANSNPDYIYATTGGQHESTGHHVWVTTDSGGSWAPRNTGLPAGVGIRGINVHPNVPGTAYLACDVGVYKTTDTGGTWTAAGLSGLGCYDVAIDPANPEHIFAATTAGVYFSTNGGSNWSATVGIPAGVTVTSLSLNATSRHLAASTYGRGAYVLDLSQ